MEVTWISAFELAGAEKRDRPLSLSGANFQDCLLPTIECDVVVFRPAGSILAEFFFITLLEYIEIEGDLLGEVEHVLEVFVATTL